MLAATNTPVLIIPPMQYDIDWHEFNGLRNWYGKQPRLVRVACSMMLNRFAYGVRDEAVVQIGKLMVVRNPGFVRNRIRYTKASSSQQINLQKSLVGSVAIKGSSKQGRFTGWTEQEKGDTTPRNRFAMLAARGGNIHNRIRPSMRLKPGVTAIKPGAAGYDPRGGASNLGGFFAMLRRNKENGLIRVKDTIYKRRGKKFIIVQQLRKKQPKRIKWLNISRIVYFRKTNLDAMWASVVNSLIKPPGRM